MGFIACAPTDHQYDRLLHQLANALLDGRPVNAELLLNQIGLTVLSLFARGFSPPDIVALIAEALPNDILPHGDLESFVDEVVCDTVGRPSRRNNAWFTCDVEEDELPLAVAGA